MPGGSRPRRCVQAVLLAAAATAAGVSSAGPAQAGTSPQPVLRLHDPALVESSGLAVSTSHPGVLWTHADGGRVAEVRAVGSSGRTVATVSLDGIDPYDPEALAPGRGDAGQSALFLGDIGDNSLQRPDVSVFRFDEPSPLRDSTVNATWFKFTYPDGPHDAEALLVHPRTGRLLVATKNLGGGGLYRAPAQLVPRDAGTNRLVRVATVPPMVTDGAYLPDGRFVLRTYSTLHVYDRPGREAAVADLPLQPQGESVAADGDRLLVGSEGENSAVYAVPVPGRAAATASPTPTEEAADSGDGAPFDGVASSSGDGLRDEPGWTAYRAVRVVAIVAMLVAIVAFLRRSRRR